MSHYTDIVVRAVIGGVLVCLGFMAMMRGAFGLWPIVLFIIAPIPMFINKE